ncbi:MAG: hypothetical protein Kow00109_04110 [Acidobacteriota bacterium]
MTKEDHFLRGMDCFAENRLAEAVAEFEAALRLDPEDPDILHAVAMTHYHLGNFAEALARGEQLRALDPRNPEAYTALSLFYNALGDVPRAEEMLAEAARLGITSPADEPIDFE